MLNSSNSRVRCRPVARHGAQLFGSATVPWSLAADPCDIDLAADGGRARATMGDITGSAARGQGDSLRWRRAEAVRRPRGRHRTRLLLE